MRERWKSPSVKGHDDEHCKDLPKLDDCGSVHYIFNDDLKTVHKILWKYNIYDDDDDDDNNIIINIIIIIIIVVVVVVVDVDVDDVIIFDVIIIIITS